MNNMDAENYYPTIQIERNINARKFYAFPIIGFLVKVIFLIPVWIWMILVGVAAFILAALINPFVVLVSGKYWRKAYEINLYYLRITAKAGFYFEGLTDKYPGFGNDSLDFKLEFPYPENPRRFFAIPLLGGLVRLILLIPYLIFSGVIANGANIGVLFSFSRVLSKGQYPESTYEFTRDSMRVALASSAYLFGFSDKYPNFYIDLANHQTIKIFLIMAGMWSMSSDVSDLFSKLGSEFNPAEIPYNTIDRNFEF